MENSPGKSASWIWGISAALFTIQGVFVATSIPVPGSRSSFSWMLFGFSFGFLFGSVSALSVWTALETARFRVWISIGCNIVIAAFFTTFVVRTGGPWSVIATAWVTLIFLNVVIQGPLWFLRLRSGYTFKHVDEIGDIEHKKPQFSIGSMLVLTTAVAVIIAAGKLALPFVQDNVGIGGDRGFFWVLMFLFFSIGATTTTLGALWFISTRKLIPLIVSTFLWACFVTASIFQMRALSPGSFTEACGFSVTCSVVAVAMVSVPLWVLYMQGRRLTIAV